VRTNFQTPWVKGCLGCDHIFAWWLVATAAVHGQCKLQIPTGIIVLLPEKQEFIMFSLSKTNPSARSRIENLKSNSVLAESLVSLCSARLVAMIVPFLPFVVNTGERFE